jgi:DHA2 family lincomycin resistance protein-like MFS transporter
MCPERVRQRAGTLSRNDDRTPMPDAPTDITNGRTAAASSASASPARASSTPAATAAVDSEARNRLVITLLLISGFVVILNETIMSVALDTLMTDLGISETSGQWLTTAFLLTTAIVIPITGFLLQRFHTRTVFLAAMVLFSTGTLLAAIAPGFGVLLVGRIVQASGTAIMMPLLFTTVLTLVPAHRRGRVMGNISIVISVAPALGPTVSGLILSTLGWRWMFIIVLPFALAALVLGALRIPNVTEPRKTPLDVLSVVLAAFGFGGLVYGLTEVGTVARGSSPVWLLVVPLAIAVVGLALFVARQLRLQKRDEALLDLRTFRSSTFSVSMIMAIVSMMSLFGTLTLVPLYMINVLDLPPLAVGLALLPGGLIMGVLAPFVGRIFDRYGPRVLVVVGSVVVSGVLWSMAALFTATTPVSVIIGTHVALSVGLALMFTPLFTSGLGSLPPKLYSHGSAILGTVQQVAGAAGVAVFVTVLAASAGDTSAGVRDLAAYATGVHNAFMIGAILSLVAIPLAWFVRRPPESADAPPMH